MNPLRVWIGYDSREPAAYHVLAHSILRRASRPVSITPLALNQLAPWLYTRQRTANESTQFSFSRFLVPYLSGYLGISLYLDADMLCLTDIAELPWDDGSVSVSVVQHDYVPKLRTKFLEYPQTVYPRKNWSSLMLMNNWRCRALTPEYVNTATGAQLHRFAWMRDEEIRGLPLEWNVLVGEENQTLEWPRIIHWTNGGVWFEAHRDEPYAKEWFAERDHMLACG